LHALLLLTLLSIFRIYLYFHFLHLARAPKSPVQYIYIKRAFHGEHPFGHLSAFEKRQLKEAADKAEKERRRKGDAGTKEAQQPAAPTMSDEEVAAQLSAAAE
jgi:hypothetical protein